MLLCTENTRDLKKKELEFKLLDLSEIEVTHTISDFVCTKMKVLALKLGKTRGNVSTNLKPKHMQELSLHSNDLITGEKITVENFQSLKTLVFVNCRRLCFHSLSKFVFSSEKLESLEIIDCAAYDSDYFTLNIIEAIF